VLYTLQQSHSQTTPGLGTVGMNQHIQAQGIQDPGHVQCWVT